MYVTLHGLLLLVGLDRQRAVPPAARLSDEVVIALGRLARGATSGDEQRPMCIAGGRGGDAGIAQDVGLALLASSPRAMVHHFPLAAAVLDERSAPPHGATASRVASVFGAQRFVVSSATTVSCALLVVLDDAVERLGAVAARLAPRSPVGATYVALLRGERDDARLRDAAVDAGLFPVVEAGDFVVARRPWAAAPAARGGGDGAAAANLLIERAQQLIRAGARGAQRMQRAACHLSRVLRARPHDAAVRSDLGSVLAMAGLRGLAQTELRVAVAAQHAGAAANLAVVQLDIDGAALNRTADAERAEWNDATADCNGTAELLLAIGRRPLASDAVRGVGPCADPVVPPITLARVRAGWGVIPLTDSFVGRR